MACRRDLGWSDCSNGVTGIGRCRLRIAASERGVLGEPLTLLGGGLATEPCSGSGVAGDLLLGSSRAATAEQVSAGLLDGGLRTQRWGGHVVSRLRIAPGRVRPAAQVAAL